MNEWVDFQLRYPIGKEIEGKIIKKMPFGVFIDIGEKFLVLLEIIEIEGLDYEKYTSDEQFNVGESVSGVVGGFTENNKQMRILQKSRDRI